MEEDLFRCGEQLSCDSVGPSNRISEPAAAVSSTFKDVADSHADRNAQLNSSHDPKSLVRCTDNADASSCKNDFYNSPDSQICVNSGRVLVVETLCSGNVEERTLFTRDLTKAASENLTGSDHICFIKQQHRNSDLHNVSAVSDTQTSTDNNVSEISATSRHKNCTVQVPVKHMTLQAPTAINHITSQVYTAVEQVHSQTKKSIHCKDSAFDTGEHKVFINIQPSSQDIPPATQAVSHLSSSVSQTQKRTASEAHHLQQEAEFSIDTPAHSNNPACPTTQESNGSVYPGTVQFSSSGFQHRRSEAQSDDQRTIIVAQNNDSVPGTISYKEKLQFENALQDHNLDLNRTVHFRGYDMQASKKSCGSKIACGSEKSNLLTQTVSQNLQNEDEALVGDLAIQKELHVNSGIPTALKSFDSVHHAPVEDCCKDEIFQTTSNIEQHITRDSRSEGHINTSDSRTEGCIDTSDSRTEDRIDTSEHNACLLPAADAFSATQAHDSDAESMILIMTRSSSLESSSTLAQESSLCTAPCVDTRTATAQAPHCNSFGSLEATDVYSRAVEAVASTSHGQAQLECTDTENKTVVDHGFDIQTTVEGTKIANAIVTQMNDQRIEIALNSNESLAEMKLGIQHTSVSGQSVVEGASLVRSSDLQDGSTESQTAPRHTNLALETALVGGCCEAQTAVIHTDVGAQTFRQQSDLALTDSGIINSVTEINNSGLESSSAVHCRSQEMKSNLQEDAHEIQTNKQTISRTRELMKEVESTMAICGVKTVISVDSYVVEQDQEPKAYLFTNDNSFHNTDALGDYMDIAEPNIISEDQSSLHVMNTEALKPVENGNSGIQSVLPQSQDVNFDTDVNVRTSENCITCKDNMLPEKYDAGPFAKMSKIFDVLAHSEDAAPSCTEHSKSIPQDLKHQPCVHVEKSHMSTTQGKCSDYRGVVKLDTKLSSFGGDEKYSSSTENIGSSLGTCVGENIDKKGEKNASISGGKIDMSLGKSVNDDKVDMSLGKSVGHDKTQLSLGKSIDADKTVMNLRKSVDGVKPDMNLGKPLSDEKINAILEQTHSFYKINTKVDTCVNYKKTNTKVDTCVNYKKTNTQDVSAESGKIDGKSNFVGDKKFDTNLTACMDVKMGRNVGATIREKCETHSGTPVHDEKVDIDLRASVLNEKGDTNLSASVGNEKGDTNLGVSVSNEKGDTNLSVSVGNEKRDTNLSVSVGNEKSDTNLGVSLSNEKGDTNLGVSVGNEKSDTNLGVSVGNEKSDTNLEKSANNEKIDTNASIYVSDGDDTNFSIYVSDADDTHASIYVSDGDESASVDVVSVSDADEDKRDTPEEAARKLPKLKVVLKRCDTSQTSLYNHRSETPDSQSSESHTSEIPKRGRKRKRSSDGSLIANSNKTKSYKQKLEESKLSQRGNKQKLDEGKLSQKGTKKIMHTLSDTSHSSRYNHRRDASDSQSSESHTSEIPKRGRKKKRSDESSIANSSKTRSYKQKLKESKLTQRGNKRAKSSSSDSSQTSRYETSDWESSQSYTTEKPKKRKKWKRSSVRSLIANKSKTKSYKQKHEQSKLSHQSVKRAKYTMRKFNNYKSTRGGKSQTGSNTAKKSTTGYSKEFKPLRTCVYSNQNNRTRPSRYFNLRSLDVMRSLRSKAEISSKNDKRSASCGNTLAQKKKNYTTKAKHKPPPESPPLDPTLPFVEVDLDIVVDESQYFEPIEPALEDAQPQPQPEQTKKKRGKPKAHKVSTGSNSTVSSGSQFVDAAACDLRHKCCQKAAITTSEVSTQWEDPSRWYAALETLTSKAKRSNVKTELTDDSTHVDAFIRDMTIVQGNQNLQRDQDLNLHGDQSYNLHGGQNYNQQDQNYNLQGGQNYNQQDQNYNLQGGQNYNQQDQSYNLQGGQNYNLQDQNYNQQDQNYNLQGDQSYNLQGGQSYNLQGGHNYNLQGGQNYNQDQSYNLQGDQNYNQQDQNYNVQGDQNYNQQDQNYNLQAAHNYNLQDQNYNLQGAQNYNLHGGHNYEQLNQQYLPTYSNQNTAEDIKMAACEPLLSAFSRPATVSSMPGNQLPAAAEDILVGWQRPQSSHLFGTASSSVVPVSVTSVHQTSQDLGNRLNFQYDLQSDVHSDTDTTHSNNNCLKFQRKKSRDVSKDSSCTKDSHSPAPPHNLDLTSCRKKNSRDIPIDSASSTEDLHTAASQRNLDLNSQKKKSREISIDSASSTEDSHTAAAPRNLDLKSQKKKKSREISRDSASSTEDLHTAAPRRNLDLKSQKKKKNSREIVIDSASSTEDSHTAAAQHNLDLKSKKKKKSRDISIDSASSTEDLQTAAPQRNFDLKSQKKNKSRDISKDSANSTKDSNKAAPPKNSDIKRKKLKRNKKTAGGPKKRRKDGDDSVMIVIDDSNGDSDVNIVCIEGHIPSS